MKQFIPGKCRKNCIRLREDGILDAMCTDNGSLAKSLHLCLSGVGEVCMEMNPEVADKGGRI